MKKRKTLRNLLLLAGLIATAGVLYGYKEYNRKTKSLHEVEAEFIVQSATIISQFGNDEKKANTMYSGKTVSVSGLVRSADRDEKGFYTIVLVDSGAMSSVRCSIDSIDTKKAGTIQPNSAITIKGVCTGYNADEMGLGADVLLNRCVIDEQ